MSAFKLAIIGPGLLGGSIALAAQRLPGISVAIWARRAEAVAEILEHKVAPFASTDLGSVARGADLVVLCVPIGVMATLAAELAFIVPAHAIVTDVGSVKGEVVEKLTPLFHGLGVFVGSHPMAGSEQTGLSAARADLFKGSVCIVTPGPTTPAPAVEKVTAFWESLGCRVRQLAPEVHDRVVAHVSHSPHVVASAVVQAAVARGTTTLEFAGPGFRDTTRVASGPPEMWTEILRTNAPAVRESVEEVIAKLQDFLRLLDCPSPEGDRLIHEFLSQAKAQRDGARLPL